MLSQTAMITSAEERFTCALYPEPRKLSEAGLTHAYNSTAVICRWSENHPRFKIGFAKSDFIEAMAMLILESTYRWEHLGGKEEFKKICPFPDEVK